MPYQFPFLLADFFCNGIFINFFCIIHHVKIDAVMFAASLCQDTVFAFLLLLDIDIMLCHTNEHILAFANVNKRLVNADAVYSRLLILFTIPIASEVIAEVFHIAVCSWTHQNINSPFSFCHGLGDDFSSLLSSSGLGITTSLIGVST